MDLIFHNGEKLYRKQDKAVKYFSELLNEVEFMEYQKVLLNEVLKQNKTEYNVFGDDFKVEIIPQNPTRRCYLSIKDYDENQKFEGEINIDFTKDELSQFINLLQVIREKME